MASYTFADAENGRTIDGNGVNHRPMKTASEVANYFIGKAHEEGKPLTHLKLQKLLYVAYGWYYVQFGERLFNEVLQAWQYGPVVASVYEALKHNGDLSIHCEIEEEREDQAGFYHTPMLHRKHDADVIKFLDDIWSTYSKYSAIELTNYSHVPGSPWHNLVQQYGGNVPRGKDLDDLSIISYFKSEKERIGPDKFSPGK